MKYHLLLSRDSAGQPWRPEFGSHDRAVVVAERQDRRDSGIRASHLEPSADRAHEFCKQGLRRLLRNIPEHGITRGPAVTQAKVDEPNVPETGGFVRRLAAESAARSSPEQTLLNSVFKGF